MSGAAPFDRFAATSPRSRGKVEMNFDAVCPPPFTGEVPAGGGGEADLSLLPRHQLAEPFADIANTCAMHGARAVDA
jgi:hypothetical protein